MRGCLAVGNRSPVLLEQVPGLAVEDQGQGWRLRHRDSDASVASGRAGLVAAPRPEGSRPAGRGRPLVPDWARCPPPRPGLLALFSRRLAQSLGGAFDHVEGIQADHRLRRLLADPVVDPVRAVGRHPDPAQRVQVVRLRPRSATTRSTIDCSDRHVVRSSTAAFDQGIGAHSHAAFSSNTAVNRDPGQAHDTAAATPWTGHATRAGAERERPARLDLAGRARSGKGGGR
jgi:hypothetical protein